jgi:hypothetical protein
LLIVARSRIELVQRHGQALKFCGSPLLGDGARQGAGATDAEGVEGAVVLTTQGLRDRLPIQDNGFGICRPNKRRQTAQNRKNGRGNNNAHGVYLWLDIDQTDFDQSQQNPLANMCDLLRSQRE